MKKKDRFKKFIVYVFDHTPQMLLCSVALFIFSIIFIRILPWIIYVDDLLYGKSELIKE